MQGLRRRECVSASVRYEALASQNDLEYSRFTQFFHRSMTFFSLEGNPGRVSSRLALVVRVLIGDCGTQSEAPSSGRCDHKGRAGLFVSEGLPCGVLCFGPGDSSVASCVPGGSLCQVLSLGHSTGKKPEFMKSASTYCPQMRNDWGLASSFTDSLGVGAGWKRVGVTWGRCTNPGWRHKEAGLWDRKSRGG